MAASISVDSPPTFPEATADRSVLKVALSVLMATEAILVAFLLAMKLTQEGSLSSLSSEVRIRYTMWLALAADIAALLGLALPLLLATVALWQDGWGRGYRLGPV